MGRTISKHCRGVWRQGGGNRKASKAVGGFMEWNCLTTYRKTPIRRMHRKFSQFKRQNRSEEKNHEVTARRGLAGIMPIIGFYLQPAVHRVYRDYPRLNDDEFVREERDIWIRP